MLMLAAILFVSIATALLPIVVESATHYFLRLGLKQASPLLAYGAAFCMAISLFLPEVYISSETHTFQQHFVGGGVYAGLLYVYVRQLLGVRWRWYKDVAVLFAVVSSLGVLVELAEFAGTHLGLVHMATGDTDWDLLANTSGALLTFGLVRCAMAIHKSEKWL
jgi:hypothetical protein